MKNILLVNPPYNKEVYKENKNFSVHPPVGLAYLASFLREHGYSVDLLDANALGYTKEQLIDHIIAHPAKHVGITSVTATIGMVCGLCDRIKERSDKVLILGGQHVTFRYEDVLTSCRSIDYIIRGEGEVTLLRLLNRLNGNRTAKGLMGITYAEDGKVIAAPDRPPIKDINRLPVPAWDLLPRSKYRLNGFQDIGFNGEKLGKLISTRGCPNKCTFCSSAHFWGKARFRNVDNIFAELEYLTKELKVKQIDFMDDCLTIPASRFKELCTRMIDSNMGLKWSCYSRVQNITEEIVQLMKEAGCFMVQLGIESGNEDVLKSTKKNITLEQVTKAVALFNKYDIDCLGFFMIGHPEDTRKTVHETVDFARNLNIDFPFFSVTTPFPGTELYDTFMSSGFAPDSFNWDQFSTHSNTIYRTKNLTSGEIKELYDHALRTCYFNPFFIGRLIKKMIKDPYKLPRYWKLFRAFMNI